MVKSPVDFIGEEARRGRTPHAWKHTHINNSVTPPSSLIHSTVYEPDIEPHHAKVAKPSSHVADSYGFGD